MNTRDDLAFDLGAAVAKAACQLWAGPATAGASLTQSVGEIFARQTKSRRDQRRAERVFERIGDEISSQLDDFLTAEFNGLPSNERNAAAETVAILLGRGTPPRGELFELNFDPLSLEQRVREAGEDLIRTTFLSSAGSMFFDQLLRECCNYVVELAISMPDFTAASAVEILRREDILIELIRTMLENFPRQAPNSSTFDIAYQRQLLRQYDSMELFGVDLSGSSRRYALSAAYMSLTVTSGANGRPLDRHRAKSPNDSSPGEGENVPAEIALSLSNRTVIRGDAGSGKTTLLRWLAVQASRGKFEGNLVDWNGRTPILVELRRFANETLPSPEDFIASVSRPIKALQPPSWVTTKLQNESAILLVDGVDELPAVQRPAAFAWVEELTTAYPTLSIIVTSRPAAVAEDWLRPLGFQDVDLQPMSPDDVSEFVSRWHKAVAAGLTSEEEKEKLSELERSLLSAIRRVTSLRNLATSPLLCAMLCGLNRDRRHQLPRDRFNLYRVVLETLVDRRDAERGVTADAVTDLGLTEKLVLLKDYAYWLLVNGMTASSPEDLRHRFAQKLAMMPRVDSSADDVFTHMIVRSGVLRQPSVDQVDFIHRTFLEYLAASEVMEQNSLGFIISRAHLDQWRETVILAAGHAGREQRTSLIQGLIDRPNSDKEHQHVLQLLAVACLETSVELPDSIQTELHDFVKKLVPPQNVGEAKALASANELVVGLLRHSPAWYAHQAVAAIRCLTIIGSDEALEVLSTYSGDSRVTVARELIKSWASFDAEVFATTVLRTNGLDYGHLYLTNPRQIEQAHHLKRLQGISVRTSHRSWDMVSATDLPLTSLYVSNNALLTNLEFVRNSGTLRSIDISGCDNLVDLAAISSMVNLETLELSVLNRRPELPPLSHLPALRSVSLISMDLTDLNVLRGVDLTRLYAWNNLDLVDISALASMESLRILDLDFCRSVEDYSALRSLASLHTASLAGATFVSSDALLTSEHLANVVLTNAGNLRDLYLPSSVEWIDVSGCPQLESLETLGHCRKLKYLRLWESKVRDLRPLEGIENLRLDLGAIDENGQDFVFPESSGSWEVLLRRTHDLQIPSEF